MALSNRDRVERVLDALRDGLGRYVIREYKMVYKGHGLMNAVEQSLGYAADDLPDEAFRSEEGLLRFLDVHKLLTLMLRDWNNVFHDKLGHVGRSYVSELYEARNSWAHQKAFTNDQAYRVADTAQRLLKMVTAADEAARVEEISKDLLRLRYENEREKAKKATSPLNSQAAEVMGLKPWRDVITPHPDVASGHYIEAEFAADPSCGRALGRTCHAFVVRTISGLQGGEGGGPGARWRAADVNHSPTQKIEEGSPKGLTPKRAHLVPKKRATPPAGLSRPGVCDSCRNDYSPASVGFDRANA